MLVRRARSRASGDRGLTRVACADHAQTDSTPRKDRLCAQHAQKPGVDYEGRTVSAQLPRRRFRPERILYAFHRPPDDPVHGDVDLVISWASPGARSRINRGKKKKKSAGGPPPGQPRRPFPRGRREEMMNDGADAPSTAFCLANAVRRRRGRAELAQEVGAGRAGRLPPPAQGGVPRAAQHCRCLATHPEDRRPDAYPPPRSVATCVGEEAFRPSAPCASAGARNAQMPPGYRFLPGPYRLGGPSRRSRSHVSPISPSCGDPKERIPHRSTSTLQQRGQKEG